MVNKPDTGVSHARDGRAVASSCRRRSGDVAASLAKGRAGCDEIQKLLTTWPSWFFARGDLAAGGAGDESPLVFDDATLKVEPAHRFTYAIAARGGRGRGGPSTAGPQKVYLTFNDVAPGASTKPVVIWRNPRIVTRAFTAGRGAPATGAAAATPPAGRGGPGPVLSTRSLREMLSPEAAEALSFGTSPDGTELGPDDFATAASVSFTVDVPAGDTNVLEFQADAELGQGPQRGGPRDDLRPAARAPSRDAASACSCSAIRRSAGYETFRAGIAEYVALLPPNSHGEANPADKDPVPPPFDNTYNSPEHDAFVLKVKYQRSDDFFTENMVDGADRAALESGLERSVRLVAVPRRLPRHARRPLRPRR